ncbi:putative zinc-binding metallopeptidase [Candidatus Pelagibacter sp.]|nr:putative zinc-binding metallopeptidase [Candidatus Pelagibacter sp.]
MRILILLLFFINIAYVNADEIYNLLKIPNLEIFKLKSKNNIRYLNTNNDFKIGVDNNITCKKTKKINLEKKFPVIEKNLSLYNSNFLKKIQLKYIVLCEELFISDINTGGIPDTQKRTLILDINFNQKYFERMIHHEIFHMIQRSHQNYFDEELFSNFNEPKFAYAECATCSDKLNLDLYENTNGFLTEYSKSIPSEDMAEIFSFLMINKSKVNELIRIDPILKNKVDLIKSVISKIDKNIL